MLQDNAGQVGCTQCSYVLPCRLHHIDLQGKVTPYLLMSIGKLNDHVRLVKMLRSSQTAPADIADIAMDGLVHSRRLEFE